jgi:hypothetical protein
MGSWELIIYGKKKIYGKRKTADFIFLILLFNIT